MSFINDVRVMESARLFDYPEAEVKYAECPVCGYGTHYSDFKGLFINEDGEIVGCSSCLRMIDEYGQDMRIEGRYI